MQLHTIGFRSLAAAIGLIFFWTSPVQWANAQDKDLDTGLRDRVRGMLLGSLIGDAVGGPVEFQDVARVSAWKECVRNWPPGTKLTKQKKLELAASVTLLGYDELRPNPEPYAHWAVNAPPGTITDDSRHKIVLINALRNTLASATWSLDAREFAQAYVDFSKTNAITSRPHYADLCENGFGEYVRAARWAIGQRNGQALPPSRLWAGVPTNAGQMALPPLAAVFAGDPTAAYQSAYQVGFIDNGEGKDINSAIVAGLSKALVTNLDGEQSRTANSRPVWASILDCMQATDPYEHDSIPFVKRSVRHWIEFSRAAVAEANGDPKTLFDILEKRANPKYYWDAHFVFACAVSIIEFCDCDPLAAIHLSVDFGFDTDSTAQLTGCFVGAMYGSKVFPDELVRPVETRLRVDYDESVEDWVDVLMRSRAAGMVAPNVTGGRDLINDYPAIPKAGLVNVVVEIPSGTNAKWEVDKQDGKLKWQLRNGKPRVVKYLPYPGNYGMIPRTLLPKDSGADGDPLDVLVLGPALRRGAIVPARIIGVLKLLDGGEQDDKLIAVLPGSDFGSVHNFAQLKNRFSGTLEIVETWFANYKGPGEMESKGIGGVAEAGSILAVAMNAYESELRPTAPKE